MVSLFLSEDAPYYGDENGGYGTTTLQLANGQMPAPIDSNDYFNGQQQQANYQQQLAFEDETAYNNSQVNSRVIREIIV